MEEWEKGGLGGLWVLVMFYLLIWVLLKMTCENLSSCVLRICVLFWVDDAMN